MLGLFDPFSIVSVQYYPLDYALVVIGTPESMLLLVGRIVKALDL